MRFSAYVPAGARIAVVLAGDLLPAPDGRPSVVPRDSLPDHGGRRSGSVRWPDQVHLAGHRSGRRA